MSGDDSLAKDRRPEMSGAPRTALTEALFGNEAIVERADLSSTLSSLGPISIITTSFKDLEWGDRERFRTALAQYPQATSELTFVNLYAWTSIQYPRWGEFNDHILVSYDPGNTGLSTTFLPPIGPDPVGTMVRLHQRFGASFERVPEHLLHQLPDGVEWQLKAKDHDYLYTPEQIRTLSGGPASELRRRLSKFHRAHDDAVTSLPLTQDNLVDARKITGAWLEERLAACQSEGEKEGKKEDALACTRILNKWSELSELRGSVIYVNDEPVSLAVGELVPHPQYSAGALVSHFEKSVIRKDLEGLPVHCFQALCSELPPGVVVNRMQDAGVTGLQKWKQSWGPFDQGKKGRVG